MGYELHFDAERQFRRVSKNVPLVSLPAALPVLQLLWLIGGGDPDLAVEVVMPGHEVAVLRRQIHRPVLEPGLAARS